MPSALSKRSFASKRNRNWRQETTLKALLVFFEVWDEEMEKTVGITSGWNLVKRFVEVLGLDPAEVVVPGRDGDYTLMRERLQEFLEKYGVP